MIEWTEYKIIKFGLSLEFDKFDGSLGGNDDRVIIIFIFLNLRMSRIVDDNLKKKK